MDKTLHDFQKYYDCYDEEAIDREDAFRAIEALTKIQKIKQICESKTTASNSMISRIREVLK